MNLVNMLMISYGLTLALKIVMIAGMFISAIAIIILVTIQKGGDSNVSAISGQSSDTFYGKKNAKSKERLHKRWTCIAGVVIAVCSIAFFILEILL